MNSAPGTTDHRPPIDPADNISAQIVALAEIGGPNGSLGQDMRNHGEVRWKHATHLLRLLITGAAVLRTASLPVPVDPLIAAGI